MSTLRFSNNLANSIMVQGAAAGAPIGTSSPQTTTISGGNSAGGTLLLIYKGTIENFSTFTDRSTRSSDLLITFSLGTTTNSYTDVGQINAGLSNAARSYKVGLNLTSTAASASGTATWFLLCRAGTTSLTDKGAFMGSVGASGSSADLEIPSTSIVSGNNYQSNGVYLNFPQNWTI